MLGYLIRNIFFIPVFAINTVIIASLVVVLGKIIKSENFLRKLEWIWAKVTVLASGIRLKIEKTDLRPDQNYIFISNHQSHLDTPIILSLFPNYFPRFLAKNSLFKIPFLGPGMSRTGHLSVNREDKRQGMKDIQLAVERIKQGESVLIFPEGTRNRQNDTLQDFQIGAFIIALKAKIPIVPIVIHGTGKALPKGRLMVQPGEVSLRILPPIFIDQKYSLKDRHRLSLDLWNTMYNAFVEIGQWKEEKNS